MSDPSSADPAEAPATDFPYEFDDPSHAELSWRWDDMHMPFALLARQEVSGPTPTASAGAQVRTVSATIQPFSTGIERERANCTVWPKYGLSFWGSPCAITRARSLRRGRRIVICAIDSPPSRLSKNAIWRFPGRARVIVQATTRPFST